MWENITSNNLIQAETAKAVLIKLPKSDYKYWHPKKLVRTFGKGQYSMSIGVCHDMKFKIFKNGNGKYNKFEMIDQREISLSELKEYYTKSMEQFQ